MIKLLKKKQLLGVVTSTLVSVFLAAGFVFAAVTVSTNVQVGSGTPDITLNGDDAYIGGTFEVEGVSYFGGNIHASSTIEFDGATIGFGDAITDTITVAGILNANSTTTLTPNGAWGDVVVATGNFVVGDKSGAGTLDGVDAYVEGIFEVDGNVLLGNATTDTLTVNASSTFTPGAAGGGVIVSTGNFRVGTGTAPDVALNGEDAYVEGTFEVDGAAQFDGAFSVLSAATTTLTMTSSGTAGTCFVVDQVDGSVAYARFTGSGITVNGNDCQ